MSFYRDMIITALRRLLPDSLVKSDGPGAMHITVNRQEDQKRTVIHMLYYVPEQRTAGPETVEEVIPLHDIKLSLKTSAPGRVYLAPEGRELAFSIENGYTNVVVPELKGHTMVVFED